MKKGFWRQGWFLILLTGITLFFVLINVMNFTRNINLLPSVILIGAFTIPIAFVTYFYEHVRDRDISVITLSMCFLVGGLLGLIAAALIEYSTLQKLDVINLIGVGFIEELVKLIFPVAMYITWKYRHEADGLLFGVAAGMGFAALETMGYGLTTIIQSRGDITQLQQVLLTRGLLSPAGHAAWTGLVCAELWRHRARTNHVFGPSVIGVFLLAVVLHSLWNIASSASTSTAAMLGLSFLGLFAVVFTGLFLLFRRYRRARVPYNFESS
jgi:protease PrsW